ncbi:tripartite tricarboxylate transporter family receptor [Variibacter gotjawalensis]|uniref:Tripartite tricarboxylate transporter family receptor n=1 Tax=Variibacter gotjawalensis TaxID=1333996 RepID=A0A0S3PVG2_9BRAD|nr:tripartite tricarboxylate transporter substrate binding protein [Variibacter gotjawalensis]NIK45712.1 tripartite-type tricarboxylate transporter receptor subunit TctC [Variibacter gotjawalensis]RZS47638.1 tripartite-type tricarboxylate transporter receptor subunit TctC [Variibacter gotjawalensis]BAT59890.1 tripartite tricarboxylate transporter family receptor [Variibacter gotjawalensis]
MRRRRFLAGAGALLLAPSVVREGFAQTYPARPVKFILGYPPGGATDITARLMAQWLTEKLGQTFIVENKPGGGTNIAADAVIAAPNDGYTLLVSTPANAINASLYEKLNHVFVRDTIPVAGFLHYPNVAMVHPSVPFKTIPELIAYAKQNPGKVNCASSGNGSTLHMSCELLKMMAGINITHVPYRGAAPAATDLIGGQTQMMFDAIATGAQFVRDGKAGGLATTGKERAEVLPNTPTIAEFLPGYESTSWFALNAPKGAPNEIVELLNREVNAILATERTKQRFAELGSKPLPGSAADLGRLIADETEKWAKVVKFAGVKVT